MNRECLLLDEFTWRKIIAKHIDAKIEAHSRRSWKRYRVEGSVIAEYRLDDKLHKRSCGLLEVSAGGLMIRMDHEIPQGTWIDLQIELEEATLLSTGMTCHCTQTIGGYKVGIRLLL